MKKSSATTNMENLLKEITEILNSSELASIKIMKYGDEAYGYTILTRLIKNEDGSYTPYNHLDSKT